MSDLSHHTRYHPRWYRRRMSVWWWLKNRAYSKFVLRELTSVFVALFAILFLWQLRALAHENQRSIAAEARLTIAQTRMNAAIA